MSRPGRSWIFHCHFGLGWEGSARQGSLAFEDNIGCNWIFNYVIY